MIALDSPCFNKLEVGDRVIVRLPNHARLISFPVTSAGIGSGVERRKYVLIGSNLRYNIGFVKSADYYLEPDVIRYQYTTSLRKSYIQIERILKCSNSTRFSKCTS